MSNRIALFAGALAGVLLIAIAIGVLSIASGSPAQAQSTGVPNMRQVTVVGEGTARGTPDTANVEIGVETLAPTTNEALEQNNTQVNQIINRLKDMGVAEEDIQTSNFNINPRYDNDGREITGYNVNNTVSVTIRNLEQTGSLLDEVVELGANRIYGITFSVDDPQALLDQARAEALANARAKADQLAQGSNASLGDVLVITENVGQAPPPMPLGRGGAMEDAQAASQVPTQAGQQTFRANVQVTFALQ